MFGFPADTAFAWANVISLSGLAIAAAGAVAAYQLSARMNSAHSLELRQAQSEARTQIETSRVAVAQADARTAELEKVNAELQLELKTEKDAQSAMGEQTQPRDMTKHQIVRFVETIKGRVRQLNLFTIPDPEASVFGVTVLDALQKAGVSVTWYRTESMTPIQGVANTGVTIYDYPGGEGDGSVGRTLLQAFTDINVQSNLLSSTQPLRGFPSPSVIVALKPPEFLRPSQDPIPSSIESAVPFDLLSRAE